jgi:hypothetical protein
MRIQKTWLTVNFCHGDAYIEATLNYDTLNYSLTHGHNDRNVTFSDEDIQLSIDRAKCVTAALKFIKQELFPKRA